MPQERVHTKQSPLRCPFCHESVDVEAGDVVVCEGCLARHHGACWAESGACSACQATNGLQAVGEAVEAAELTEARPDLVRLIDAHERGPSRGDLDYLLSPLTLGLFPLIRAELRLRDHLKRTPPQLADGLPPEARERAARYRTEGFEAVAVASAARLGGVSTIFATCLAAGVFGVALLTSGYTLDEDFGTAFVVGAILVWIGTVLSALSSHWRAVRRHDSRQLYLGLLANGTPEAEAQEALERHEQEWSDGGQVAFMTILFTVLLPAFPIIVAWTSQLALKRHEAREESAPNLQPKDTGK